MLRGLLFRAKFRLATYPTICLADIEKAPLRTIIGNRWRHRRVNRLLKKDLAPSPWRYRYVPPDVLIDQETGGLLRDARGRPRTAGNGIVMKVSVATGETVML